MNTVQYSNGTLETMRSGVQPREFAPISTIVVLGITVLATGAQFVWPHVLQTLRRTPDALQSGQWWRSVSPLFVHAYGWPHLLFNVAWIAPVGVIVERRYGHLRWLALYFVSGVIGEAAGFAWEPHGAGASLGGSGLLGGLAVWLLVHRQTLPWRILWWGPFIIVAAMVLTLRHDIHGPPMLAGAVLGALILPGSDQQLV
jgi:membrane associated rhomboid family serine protease